MVIKVANDDVESFKNDNKWLEYHPSNALIFSKLKETWEELKPTYETDFKALVYGNLPNESELFEKLKLIKKRLKSMGWDIKINS